MSFFNFEEPVTGKFETGGGDIEPMPAKTQVLAAPDEAKWDTSDREDAEFISIRWSVLKPAEYNNRKVFQKLHVKHADQKKADKALRMLAAIDANAGGKLMKAGDEPTDQSLTATLVNKPMMLMLQLWELETETGEKKRGNWVSAVSPRAGGAEKKEPVATKKPAPIADPGDFDDDIPF